MSFCRRGNIASDVFKENESRVICLYVDIWTLPLRQHPGGVAILLAVRFLVEMHSFDLNEILFMHQLPHLAFKQLGLSKTSSAHGSPNRANRLKAMHFERWPVLACLYHQTYGIFEIDKQGHGNSTLHS